MRAAGCPLRCPAILFLLAPAAALAAEPGAKGEAQTTVAATGFYYAMRDQPNFGVGVASLNRGSLHLEARYNYEARDAASAFVGWKFAGGDAVTWEATPILGALFGTAHGVVPGVEASVAYGAVDAYIEAEYVPGQGPGSASYYYAWSELGWTPAKWLRIGLVGQRTHAVDDDRDLQRGVFGQLITDRATLGIYAFNPDSGSRYVVVSLGVQF